MNEQTPQKIELSDLSKIIKPGFRIFLGTGCSEPLIISQKLVRKTYRWFDCQIIHFLTVSPLKYFSEVDPTHFRHQTLSIIGSDQMRKAVNQGKSDYIPIKSSEIPRLLKKGALPIDLAFLQTSPPDEYGYCSLGINVDINLTVAKTAEKLVLVINQEMPRTAGDTGIKFSEADFYLENNAPLLEYPDLLQTGGQRAEIMEKIGPYIAKLIEDGSTLNVGLGKLAPTIWNYLGSKKNLAIYSEVLALTPSLFHLIEKGVLNCSKSTFPHIMTSFVVGTNELYKKLHHHPMFEFQSTEFITNIERISQNNKICSIYGAMQVDLTGQVSNHLPKSFYSGIGGELDFLQGTALNSKGKSIIILPSTAKGGKISRIVPSVQRASVPAADIHYVVTEYGIARLAGRNIRERALQLIGIAHPDFRLELLEYAKKTHLIYEDQILPISLDGHIAVYPEKYEWIFQTKDGQYVFFRPVKPTDESLLQDFFYHLDEKSKRLRFLTPKKIFPHEQTQLEVNIDYYNTMAIIGMAGHHENEGIFDQDKIVCAGSYYRDLSGNSNWAEMATIVAPDWQNRGIGTHIFKKLIEIAIDNEITGLFGEIDPANIAILTILEKIPYEVNVLSLTDRTEFKIELTRSSNN